MRVGEEEFALSEQDMDQLLTKYHFQEKEKNRLFQLYEEIGKRLQVIVSYDRVKEKIPILQEEEYGIAIVSLGEEWEKYEERLKEREKYWEVYAVSCFGMEVLRKVYVWIEKQWEREEYFVEKYYFLGEHLPVEWIPWVFSKLKPEGVVYYKQSMIKPLSSVCYLVSFREKKGRGGLCKNCSSTDCPYREEIKTKEMREIKGNLDED